MTATDAVGAVAMVGAIGGLVGMLAMFGGVVHQAGAHVRRQSEKEKA